MEETNITEAPIAAEPVLEPLKGEWFVIHTLSGNENKVKAGIEVRIDKEKLQNKIFKIMIPEEQTVEIKENKRVERTEKMFPGYVFINMIFDEELWYLVRNIPGVAKFIGANNRPEAVVDHEMLRVLGHAGEKTVKKIEVDFEIEESIKVISGPFRGYTGHIAEIFPEKGKMKVLISIFGRETPMEINFDQAEKNI